MPVPNDVERENMPDKDTNTPEGTYMPAHWGEHEGSLSTDEYDQAISMGFDPDDPDFTYHDFKIALHKYDPSRFD